MLNHRGQVRVVGAGRGFVGVGAPSESERTASDGAGQAEAGGLGARLGRCWGEGVGLRAARGQDLAGRPFPAPVGGGVQGLNVFGGGSIVDDFQGFVENALEPGVMTERAIELELRNLQERSGGWNVTLRNVDGSRDFIRVKRKRGGSFQPRVHWQRNELSVMLTRCGSDQCEVWGLIHRKLTVFLFYFVLLL